MLTYMKQLFTLVKMIQLSPLPDERMRRNEEKREEEIKPPDSILGRPLLHFGAALTPFRAAFTPIWAGLYSNLGRPLLHFGAALTPFQGSPYSILVQPLFHFGPAFTLCWGGCETPF